MTKGVLVLGSGWLHLGNGHSLLRGTLPVLWPISRKRWGFQLRRSNLQPQDRYMLRADAPMSPVSLTFSPSCGVQVPDQWACRASIFHATIPSVAALRAH